MQKILFCVLLFLFGKGGIVAYGQQRDTVSVKLLFPHHFTAIFSSSDASLDELSALIDRWRELKEHPSVKDIRFEVRGNAALDETVTFPNDVAYGRAYQTVGYLVANGVDESSITVSKGFPVIFEAHDQFVKVADTALSVNPEEIRDIVVKNGGLELKEHLMDYDSTGTAWNWFEENVVKPTCFCLVSLSWDGSGLDREDDASECDGAVIPAVVEDVQQQSHKRDTTCLKTEVRIGTNLLYDAVAVANLSFEVGFARHWAVNVLVTYSPWDLRTPDVKLRTLLIQPELRYYFANDFRRHYVGVEGHLGWYNVALPNHKIRYQDRDGNTPAWGGGLTYGYVLKFARHWGIDFSVSVGYAYFDYDCFYNIENGAKFTSSTKQWIGPTKAGISIFYQF